MEKLEIGEIEYLFEDTILCEFDSEGYYSYEYEEMDMGERMGFYGLSTEGEVNVMKSIGKELGLNLSNMKTEDEPMCNIIQEILKLYLGNEYKEKCDDYYGPNNY